MHRQIILPTEKNHTFELPEEFFGKTVEITVAEVAGSEKKRKVLPAGKTVSPEELFETFGAAPDFPDTDTLRSKAWPSKWSFLILPY